MMSAEEDPIRMLTGPDSTSQAFVFSFRSTDAPQHTASEMCGTEPRASASGVETNHAVAVLTLPTTLSFSCVPFSPEQLRSKIAQVDAPVEPGVTSCALPEFVSHVEFPEHFDQLHAPGVSQLVIDSAAHIIECHTGVFYGR